MSMIRTVAISEYAVELILWIKVLWNYILIQEG